MKKIIIALAISILTLGSIAQVHKRIPTRTGMVNQLKTYGRVSYQGLNYYPVGKDSLLVKNDVNRADSVIIPPVLNIDKKPYTVCGFREMAFEYNNDIKYVNIPSSITEIANSSFYSCHDLSECVMPSVKVIQGYAFFRTGFKRLVLPEGLTYIGGYAFHGCDHLRYVELPSSLKEIAESAFSGCRIDTVKVNFAEPLQLDGPAFEIRANDFKQEYTVLSVPHGSKDLFSKAEYWRKFRIIVEH